MNLTLYKTEFLDAIKLVKNAVSTMDLQPITKCILLSADDEGLTLTATDLEMSVVSSRIMCEVHEPGEAAIDAKLLSDIVSKLPQESITLTGADQDLQIKSGKTLMNIKGLYAEDFPLVNMDDIKMVFSGITEQNFLDLLKGTAFSVSQVDGVKPALTGVLIETNVNRLMATTSDGFRVSRKYINAAFDSNYRILFQGRCANRLIKMLNPKSADIVRFMTTNYHLIMETDKWTITTRLMTDEYPDYNHLFNNDFTTTIEVGSEQFLESLERVKVITTKSVNRVKLSQNANTLILSAGDTMGSAYDEIEAFITGPPIDINFNTDYLISIMKTVKDETVTIGLTGTNNAGYLHSHDSDYDYLVLPLRAK